MSDTELLAPPDPPEAVRSRLPSGNDRFPCTPQLGRLLAQAVATGRRRVLEFGAGQSSRILAAALALAGGGSLTSLEQDPGWCRDAWEDVEEQRGVDSRLLLMSVTARPGWRPRLDVDRTVLRARAPYDLVLVDAPQYFYGRDSTLPLIDRLLEPGALIVVDDAARAGERRTIRAWLARYPGLHLTAADWKFGGRGVALLRWDRSLRSRIRWWSPAAAAWTAYNALRRPPRETLAARQSPGGGITIRG